MAANQLRNLPRNTAMLLVSGELTAGGITYMNNSVYAFSKANPLLPVFSMTSTAIGYWAIGGYVPQYEGVGKKYGRICLPLFRPEGNGYQQHQYLTQLI